MPSRTKSGIHTVGREIRRHPFAYFTLACFVVAGPFVTHFMFPEAPPLAGLVGGVLFGGYACLCAVPDQFLERSDGE